MFLRIQSANIVIFIVILCNYLAATAVEMKKTVLVLLTALVLSACGPKDRFIQVTGHAQGGVYTVKVNLKGVSVTPEEIRDSVDAILVRVDTTLSGYNKGSLLSRFNAGETIRPNGLFLDMYRIGYGWYERSGGVLDFAAGPLFDAWGFGFKSGEMRGGDQGFLRDGPSETVDDSAGGRYAFRARRASGRNGCPGRTELQRHCARLHL